MLINLSDVLSEQHKTVDETVQLEMDTFQSRTGTFPIVSKEPVHVVAEHVKGRELLIHVDTELCILIPCDRCLEDVKQEFDLNFTKPFSVVSPTLTRKLRITMKNTFREFLIVIAAVARVAYMHGLWLVTRVKHEKRVANRQPSFHLLQFYKAMMISS